MLVVVGLIVTEVYTRWFCCRHALSPEPPDSIGSGGGSTTPWSHTSHHCNHSRPAMHRWVHCSPHGRHQPVSWGLGLSSAGMPSGGTSRWASAYTVHAGLPGTGTAALVLMCCTSAPTALPAGCDRQQLEHIARKGLSMRKVSRRDMPLVIGSGLDGATTVSGTMLLASRAGIEVFVTGGIGGVHR